MATLFEGIDNLYTFAGAAQKDGRRVVDEDLTKIKDGVIVERKGRVVWAGERKKWTREWQKRLLKNEKVNRVKLRAKTVFPAFVECHTHLIFAGERMQEFEWRNQGVTYQEIAAKGGGILSTVRATRACPPKELLRRAQSRARNFLRQGVTTLEVKSGYGLNHDAEIKILKLVKKLTGPRVVPTYLGLHAKSPDHPDLDVYVNEVLEKTLPMIAKQKLANRVDIFIEKGFFTLEHGRRLIEKARSLGFDITVHADQLSPGGTSALFAEAGAVSCDHVICLKPDEISRLAGSQSTCVLLPAADFYMKVDYPPARTLIDQGARVALATDFNPGTSPTMDLSFVGVLARLQMKMSLAEVFAAMTVGAAAALRMSRDVGSLEYQKYCDFVVSDENLENFFYEVGSHPIRAVYREGRLLKP